ncbi:MAG: peptidoglycan editing factor PgeF [Chlorobiaceae bacterium]|nr:peptidoglycan editing factor PgeF [Chlorobiaceae bacterium]
MPAPLSTTHSLSPEYIVPECFSETGNLLALQSTRQGGVSEGPYASLNLGRNTGDTPEKIHENLLLLCSAAGIGKDRLVSSNQVHGTSILYAQNPGHYDGYDAFVTDKADLFLCILTADCYPVMIYDRKRRVVGAAHAGWKGTAGKIATKTIDEMSACFNTEPSDCLAYIGTGISAGVYEVGKEVFDLFPEEFSMKRISPGGDLKYFLDLAKANCRQLLDSGLAEANIEQSPFCSFLDSEMFYSYRRDNGTTGRMVSLIGIRSGG